MGLGGCLIVQLCVFVDCFFILVYGVVLLIGGEGVFDCDYLDWLKYLIDWFNFVSFLEYLVWLSYGGEYFNDLLLLFYIMVMLDCVVFYIFQVQDVFDCFMFLENLLFYLVFVESEMIEMDFLL